MQYVRQPVELREALMKLSRMSKLHMDVSQDLMDLVHFHFSTQVMIDATKRRETSKL